MYDLIWDQLTRGWIEYSNLVYILGILFRKKKKEKVLKFLLLFEKGSHNLLILKRSIKFSCHLSNRFSSVVNCCNHQIVFFHFFKINEMPFFSNFFFSFVTFFYNWCVGGGRYKRKVLSKERRMCQLLWKFWKNLATRELIIIKDMFERWLKILSSALK